MAPFRVVLADDSPDMREIVRITLAGSGQFDVVAVGADGVAAIELTDRFQPDLLVLDIDMPELTGLDALPEIRRRSPDTKVVILSGLARARMGDVAFARGAVGYLEKGLSPSQLVEELLAVAGIMETVEHAVDTARTRLKGSPESPRSARRFIQATLERWDCRELLDVVSLLVSELVTNAVVHTAADIEMAVLLLPGAVRIEVADTSDVIPAVIDVEDEATSGRGLAIVRDVADKWGVDPLARGKKVWFEVPRPDAGD